MMSLPRELMKIMIKIKGLNVSMYKRPRIAKKKKYHLSRFKVILQSYSNKNIMVLA